jgi:CheY-like chemotaxis protein
MADDDADDRALAQIAFKELRTEHELSFVKDGQELIDHLNGLVKDKKVLPDLILLDLNMPKKDGRVALKEIKATPSLRHIEVYIFSTSASEEDKRNTLGGGARKYIVKPSDFTQLKKILKGVCDEMVER